MPDIIPVRIQLRRTGGWSMQFTSYALNGLPAVKVDRTTMWGNRWMVGTRSNSLGRDIETIEEAVDVYRRVMFAEPHMVGWARERLRGKNLACWCRLDARCHADVLLEIANA